MLATIMHPDTLGTASTNRRYQGKCTNFYLAEAWLVSPLSLTIIVHRARTDGLVVTGNGQEGFPTDEHRIRRTILEKKTMKAMKTMKSQEGRTCTIRIQCSLPQCSPAPTIHDNPDIVISQVNAYFTRGKRVGLTTEQS